MRILIVEDDVGFASVLQAALKARGYDVEWVQSVKEAEGIAKTVNFECAILDLKLENGSSLPLIPLLIGQCEGIKILVLTGYSSIATAVEAIKLGAVNYLPKPADTDEILAALLSDQPNTELPVIDNRISVKRLEWEHIQAVLKENNGNVSATARQLKMHRRTLQRKLQKRPVAE